MILVENNGTNFNLSYLKYTDPKDVMQFIKYDLESWEVAQILGGN